MKKTLIAVAALAATGAFAQVSVYGRLDVGYANTKSTSGTTEVKANGVESHNSASSMWGIQGTEDLGGGLKAWFKLEQDIYVANGNTGFSGAGNATNVPGATNAPGFNRTSMVGLSGNFGTISLGRDYTPMFKLIGSIDINSLSRISTVQSAAYAGASTTGNQIVYTTPNLSGFVGTVSVINQDTGTTTAGVETVAKTQGNNITVAYNNGPLYLGAGVGEHKTTAGATVTKTEGTAIVGGYNLGVVNLRAGYSTQEVSVNGTTGNEASELNIGAIVPMGKVTLRAQVGRNTLENKANAVDSNGTDLVLGAEYALSAKTALFAKTGTFNKLGQSGTQNEQKVTSTAVGIRTVF
jgi:predicted porin